VLFDDAEVFARAVGDDFGFSFGHGLVVDEVGAYAEREGFSFEEFLSGGEGDSARWDHVDLGEGSLESGEVLGSAHCACGEDFDDVGSGLPCGDDLGRGEGSGKHGDGVAVAHLNGLEIEGRAYDEFCAFEDAHAGGFWVKDSAGADEDVGALLGEFAHDLDGTGDCHGDLEDGDSSVGDGSGYGEGFVDGVGAEDGDETDLLEGLEDFVFLHVIHLKLSIGHALGKTAPAVVATAKAFRYFLKLFFKLSYATV
jgi:hypothetical protein